MQKPTMRTTIPILVLVCGCLIAMINYGPRSAMGFFSVTNFGNAWLGPHDIFRSNGYTKLDVGVGSTDIWCDR